MREVNIEVITMDGTKATIRKLYPKKGLAKGTIGTVDHWWYWLKETNTLVHPASEYLDVKGFDPW
jgi:hypothetical protein